MAEYGYNELQTIQPGASAILQNLRPCTHRPQLVLHEDETANITLRGIVNNMCCPMPEYKVHFSGNISAATLQFQKAARLAKFSWRWLLMAKSFLLLLPPLPQQPRKSSGT